MESLLFVESEILCLFIIQSWRTDYFSSSWSYISCENDSLIYSFYIQRRTDIHIALYALATYVNTVLLQRDRFQPHVNLWHIAHSRFVAMGSMSIIRREYHLVITVTSLWNEKEWGKTLRIWSSGSLRMKLQPSCWDSPNLHNVNINYGENLKSLGKSCSGYPLFLMCRIRWKWSRWK